MAFDILLLKTSVIVEDKFVTPFGFVGRSVFALDGVFGREDCFVSKTLFVPWLSECPALQENIVKLLEI